MADHDDERDDERDPSDSTADEPEAAADDPEADDERDDAEADEADDDGEDDEADDDAAEAAGPTEASAAPAAPGKPGSGMVLGVIGFVIALGLGFYIGQLFQKGGETDWEGYDDARRYKVELRGDEPQVGPDDALITIIEFSDYECPYCRRAHGPVMEAVEDNDDVRLIFKHFPLPGHRNALPAARAAWAAHQQGKFWEMHDYLFETGGQVSEIDDVAGSMGMDVQRFRTDMLSEAAHEAIEGDRYAAGILGIGSTPHFVINGHLRGGALGEDHWDRVIELERSEAKVLVDGGTPRAAVYDTMMASAASQRGKPTVRRRPEDGGPPRPAVQPNNEPPGGAPTPEAGSGG